MTCDTSSRRQFLQRSLNVAALSCAGMSVLHLEAAETPTTTPPQACVPPDFGFKRLGKLKTRPSLDIAASPLSVGYETLDRKHFDPERTYAHAAQLGVKWARCQTGWARTEREKGKYDFAWLDAVVDSLRKIGIQPWFNLGYGNPLYTPEADETAVGWAPIFTDTAKDAWLNFTRAIAGHFHDRVKHWEIWNEPNISGFWKPQKPNAADYVNLVKITAPIIRKAVPGAVIIGGGFAGVPIPYIKSCLEAGMGDLIDKVTYHPYRAAPESNYEKDVSAMRDLLQQHTQGRVKIWQGENGCPSEKGGAGALKDLDWNETRQAKWLLRRILSDLKLGIEFTSYFLIVDLVGYRGSTNFKGLLRGTEYTPKPSYFAYRNLCSLFDADTRAADLTVRFDNAEPQSCWTAAFERRGVPLYAYWTAADLLKDFTPSKTGISVSAGKEKALKQPVLVDPLNGQVYQLDAKSGESGSLHLAAMPLLDYPLIVTDSSALTIEG